MQVHYNTLQGELKPDDTTFEMRLTDQAPERLITTRPLVIRELDIPAGEEDAVNTNTYTNHNDGPVEIKGISAHMHLLGRELTLEVLRAGGQEECGIDIPGWDFN